GPLVLRIDVLDPVSAKERIGCLELVEDGTGSESLLHEEILEVQHIPSPDLIHIGLEAGEPEQFEGPFTSREGLGCFARLSVGEINADGVVDEHPSLGVRAFAFPATGIAVCYCGDASRGEQLLARIRKLGTPLADLIQERSYVEMQSMF